jgi:hypothetical protein
MLTDLTKKKWTLGRSIGTGGFGEIYLAQEGEGVNVRDDARSPTVPREFPFLTALLWIRDILIRIRIRGSVPLISGFGSVSCFFR